MWVCPIRRVHTAFLNLAHIGGVRLAVSWAVARLQVVAGSATFIARLADVIRSQTTHTRSRVAGELHPPGK